MVNPGPVHLLEQLPFTMYASIAYDHSVLSEGAGATFRLCHGCSHAVKTLAHPKYLSLHVASPL